MSELSLPPLQPYFPTTFLERGVSLPFTTPQLFGSRARPARGTAIELILPNPSGGRGVYILNWTRLQEFCRPTVHDRRLIQKVGMLLSITPATIRGVATEIAAEGMAGEQAMAAALAAIETERAELVIGNFLLLMALVERIEPTLPEAAAPAQASDPASDMEQRAQRAVAIIARRMDKSPAWVATSMEALTSVLRNVGLRAQVEPTRVRRMLALLREVHAEIGAWRQANPGSNLQAHAEMIRSVAELTLTLTDTMVEQLHAMADDTVTLLQTWATDPDQVIRLATQPEWMLDGWEQICLIWRQATHHAARRVALVEMTILVPVLPREVIDWAGIAREGERINQLRRFVPLNEDWRTGATVFELIARNEQLRAAGG